MLQPTSNTPLITTIIPTYRRPKLLRRAIQSALNQTYPDIQICVYDNASGDETADVVREFAKKDGRVKYYCHPKNIGAFKNFEYGMTQVTTPFFSFLSDDDLILPDFYQTALEGFDRYPEAIFSSTQTICIELETQNFLGMATPNLKPGFYQPPGGLFAILKHNHPTWTGILFRDKVRTLVGPLDLGTGPLSDLDFELRVAARFPFVISPKPGAIFHSHSNSFSANESTRFDNFWPYVKNMTYNITGDKRIALHTRDSVRQILEKFARRKLFRLGIASIMRHNFDDSYQAAHVLRSHYHDLAKSLVLYSMTRVCDSFPPAYLVATSLNRIQKYIWHRKSRIIKPDKQINDLLKVYFSEKNE